MQDRHQDNQDLSENLRINKEMLTTQIKQNELLAVEMEELRELLSVRDSYRIGAAKPSKQLTIISEGQMNSVDEDNTVLKDETTVLQ